MSPYYDDDGTEVFPDMIPKPGLCLVCKKDNDPHEEVLCNLSRLDQSNDEEFKCYAFESINAEH